MIVKLSVTPRMKEQVRRPDPNSHRDVKTKILNPTTGGRTRGLVSRTFAINPHIK